MRDELTKVIKHSGIYAIGVVLSKGISFFLIPVYTHFLTPRDYGILELLDLLIFFTTNLSAMGIYAAVFRFYAAYESEQDKKEVIATALLYTAAGSLIFTAGLEFFAPTVAGLILRRPDLAPYVRIVALTFLLSNL